MEHLPIYFTLTAWYFIYIVIVVRICMSFKVIYGYRKTIVHLCDTLLFEACTVVIYKFEYLSSDFNIFEYMERIISRRIQ